MEIKKTLKIAREAKNSRDPKKIALGWFGIVLAGFAGAFIYNHKGATPAIPSTNITSDLQSPPPPRLESESRYIPRAKGTVSFTREIAPITLNRCALCHHEGREAPFNLVTYRDVSKHAAEIADVTGRGIMPPWLPEPGYNRFLNERHLSSEEKGLIKQWVEEGTLEGNSKDLPPTPTWSDEWLLGKPDLVVTMPEPFELGAEGSDVYRNFVVPASTGRDRYVRAVEFSPGNSRIVHHAFVLIDSDHACRLLDAAEPGPGFGGMNFPADSPSGQFLGWQPGRLPIPSPPGLAWKLQKDSDFVVEAHLNRSGKPESLQSSIGLYFTDEPPTNTCAKLKLTNLTLEIPAGASNFVVTDSYALPVDVDLLAVLPHAHNLAREMRAYAVLPDGSKQWLLNIRNWDFNWQGDYRYAQPIPLPRGSTIWLNYTYDNSTHNTRNPNNPPKQVDWGYQSSDEMCELWFQALTHQPRDLAILNEDHLRKHRSLVIGAARQRLERHPEDALAHQEIAVCLLAENRREEAVAEFNRAAQLDPKLESAHFHLGVIFRKEQRYKAAETELRAVTQLNPQNSKAYGHLGFIQAELGELDEAEESFRNALKIDPEDATVRSSLDDLIRIRSERSKK